MEGRVVNGPVTAGSSLSRPSGAEQRGDRGTAEDQVAPETASGRHPGVCTLTLTNMRVHVHTHVLADTPSKHSHPQATYSYTLTHLPTHS